MTKSKPKGLHVAGKRMTAASSGAKKKTKTMKQQTQTKIILAGKDLMQWANYSKYCDFNLSKKHQGNVRKDVGGHRLR